MDKMILVKKFVLEINSIGWYFKNFYHGIHQLPQIEGP
jgi:hypothetical protein